MASGAIDEEGIAAPGAAAGGRGIGSIHKPLGAKQPQTSLTNAPTHVTSIDKADELLLRADAIITFATSINANQPVATVFDRIRAYIRLDQPAGKNARKQQFVEVEGRAIPLAAYAYSYYKYLLQNKVVIPGFDKALANTTQVLAQYRIAGNFGLMGPITVEDLQKVQPFGGVGAASAYSVNDGTGGEAGYYRKISEFSLTEDDIMDEDAKVGSVVVGRSYGTNIASLTIRKCRAWMIAAATDLNAGFVMKVGSRAYVTEEVNDIEDRIMDFLGTTTHSITGAASAAPAGHAVRGQPQDPFTGAGVFMFGDSYEEDEDVTITITTPQAIQVWAITNDGIDGIST